MSISLTRLARRRLLHQRGLAAALGAGLAAALGLSATVLGVQAVTTEAGLRHALAGIPDGGLITIQSTGPQAAAAFDAFESDADRRVTGALGGSARPVAAFATLSAAVAWTVNNERFSAEPSSVNPNPPKPALAYSEDLARHVRVTQGALPPDAATTGDHPIAVSTDQPFGLRLGDRVCLGFVGGPSDPTRVGVYPLCLRVAALWQALDPHEPYWQDRFPAWELMASRADLFAGLAATNRAGRITTVLATTGLLYQIPPGSIDASSAPGIANGLHMLHGYYSVSADSLFATQVDATIDAFEQRQQLGAYTIQLVAAALVLLALFAVSFVARRFLENQAADLAGLRARGWRRRRVWAFLLIQLGLLALVALPVGLGLAALVTLAVARLDLPGTPAVTGSDLAGIGFPLAAALAAALALLALLAAAAVRPDVLELRRGASRPAAPPWWRWRGADALAVVVALPLLAESRLRGSGQVRAAGAADDPLGLLFPGLAIALLAVASLRLLPVVTRLALRMASGVPGHLARWQLARRPAQHAGLALLVTFAVAVGVFSSIYATTDRRNAEDRAAYRAGADVRVTFGPPEPALDVLGAPRSGLAASSPALRVEATPGQANASSTVLAIDPASFPGVAWSRPGLTSPDLPGLLRQLAARDADGIELPGRPGALSVWASYSGADGRLDADLVDAAGRSATLDLGSPAGGGWRRLEAAIRFPGGPPAYPVRLRRLAMAGGAHGELALSDLAAGGVVVEPFQDPRGWWTREPEGEAAPNDVASSMTVPRDGRATLSVAVSIPDGRLTIEPPLSDRPVPALVSSTLLPQLGIGLGQAFPLHFDTAPVQVAAVRATDSFPTLYPDDAFIVLPLDAITARLARAQAGPTPANELWVRLDAGTSPAAARALARRLSDAGLPREVEVTDDLQAAALKDPLRVALDGTLLVGFLATLAMAVLAFGIHFLAAARSRLREYAILRANGLGPAQVGRSLLLEQTVLLVHGLLAGGVLGVVVSYAVLPAVQLGDAATDVLPPTVVTPDALAMAGAGLALVAACGLCGAVARRATAHVDVREQLRQLG